MDKRLDEAIEAKRARIAALDADILLREMRLVQGQGAQKTEDLNVAPPMPPVEYVVAAPLPPVQYVESAEPMEICPDVGDDHPAERTDLVGLVGPDHTDLCEGMSVSQSSFETVYVEGHECVSFSLEDIVLQNIIGDL